MDSCALSCPIFNLIGCNYSEHKTHPILYAILYIGYMYSNGQGVKKNYTLALKNYKKVLKIIYSYEQNRTSLKLKNIKSLLMKYITAVYVNCKNIKMCRDIRNIYLKYALKCKLEDDKILFLNELIKINDTIITSDYMYNVLIYKFYFYGGVYYGTDKNRIYDINIYSEKIIMEKLKDDKIIVDYILSKIIRKYSISKYVKFYLEYCTCVLFDKI